MCACASSAPPPAVKTGRPDTGELSRGQNKVRQVSSKFMDNVTPT
jgi:hypothetical protein